MADGRFRHTAQSSGVAIASADTSGTGDNDDPGGAGSGNAGKSGWTRLDEDRWWENDAERNMGWGAAGYDMADDGMENDDIDNDGSDDMDGGGGNDETEGRNAPNDTELARDRDTGHSGTTAEYGGGCGCVSNTDTLGNVGSTAVDT